MTTCGCIIKNKTKKTKQTSTKLEAIHYDFSILGVSLSVGELIKKKILNNQKTTTNKPKNNNKLHKHMVVPTGPNVTTYTHVCYTKPPTLLFKFNWLTDQPATRRKVNLYFTGRS